jgi:para-aminobenzoate synthetase
MTNMVTVHTQIEVLPTFAHLRRVSPVPFGALLDFGDVAVLSASPERFLSIDLHGTVEAKPIKALGPEAVTPPRTVPWWRSCDNPKDRSRTS